MESNSTEDFILGCLRDTRQAAPSSLTNVAVSYTAANPHEPDRRRLQWKVEPLKTIGC
jgi:hypothetical protein